MRLSYQYTIALTFGAGAAVASLVLGSMATLNPMTGTSLPIAIVFAVPLGALTGLFSLAAGRIAWRYLSWLTTNTSVATGTGCLVVAAIGLGASWIAFAGAGGGVSVPALAPSVLLTLTGATGFYFQYRDLRPLTYSAT